MANDEARSHVVQLDLRAQGISPGPAVIEGRQCRTYAEGLPQPHGGNMGVAWVNSPPALEFFAVSDAQGESVSASVLARWPDNIWDPRNWSYVEKSFHGPQNRTFVPDALTLNHTRLWEQQFREDPGSIYAHEYGNFGWADMHWPLAALSSGVNVTFGHCGNDTSISECQVGRGNYFYTYNVLSELDREGEYYINRTSQKLYVWLPAAGEKSSLAGYVSMQSSPLLQVHGAKNMSFHDLSLRYGRGVGILLNESVDIVVQNVEVAMVGLMAVNVSGGFGCLLHNLSIHDVGNGGVYLTAGDRITLTPSRHVLSSSTITDYNRWTHCYTPGVVLAGVGSTIASTSIWHAPHQAIFLSGNDHTITDCDIADVCKMVKDSGAFYAGRDLTYRGNRLLHNTWRDCNSVFPGTPALYLDDCASSVTVINNTFLNNSGPAAALEGGKDHVFIDNRLGQGQHGVHAVGKGCTGAMPYLSLVPWNSSAVWREAYPDLVAEVEQDPNAPWHLVFVNNTWCNGTSFQDLGNSTVVKYNGTVSGNYQKCFE